MILFSILILTKTANFNSYSKLLVLIFIGEALPFNTFCQHTKFNSKLKYIYGTFHLPF